MPILQAAYLAVSTPMGSLGLSSLTRIRQSLLSRTWRPESTSARTKVTKAYVGSTEVDRIYVGSTTSVLMGELLHAIASAHQHETAQGQGRRGVIPAPVGGWNTQDPEASMDASFGTQMENYFPERGRVVSRRGSKTYAETTSTSAVETLFNWVSGASNKLFAITGTALYDVTDPASVTEVAGQTITEGRWRSATMNGQGVLVNGVDEPLQN